MPVIICKKCSHLRYWHNRKGTHLKDIKCLICGGNFRKAIWEKEYGHEEFKQMLQSDREEAP